MGTGLGFGHRPLGGRAGPGRRERSGEESQSHSAGSVVRQERPGPRGRTAGRLPAHRETRLLCAAQEVSPGVHAVPEAAPSSRGGGHVRWTPRAAHPGVRARTDSLEFSLSSCARPLPAEGLCAR